MSQRRRAAAVIVRDGAVLRVHERSRRPGAQEWVDAAGWGRRAGETAEQAVRREVLEETGLVAKEVDYLWEMPYPRGASLLHDL